MIPARLEQGYDKTASGHEPSPWKNPGVRCHEENRSALPPSAILLLAKTAEEHVGAMADIVDNINDAGDYHDKQ